MQTANTGTFSHSWHCCFSVPSSLTPSRGGKQHGERRKEEEHLGTGWPGRDQPACLVVEERVYGGVGGVGGTGMVERARGNCMTPAKGCRMGDRGWDAGGKRKEKGPVHSLASGKGREGGWVGERQQHQWGRV